MHTSVKTVNDYIDNSLDTLDVVLNELDKAVVGPNWDRIGELSEILNYLATSVITVEELEGILWD
jgi:hypothetical protein